MLFHYKKQEAEIEKEKDTDILQGKGDGVITNRIVSREPKEEDVE